MPASSAISRNREIGICVLRSVSTAMARAIRRSATASGNAVTIAFSSGLDITCLDAQMND
jgi:hypothetical protein